MAAAFEEGCLHKAKGEGNAGMKVGTRMLLAAVKGQVMQRRRVVMVMQECAASRGQVDVTRAACWEKRPKTGARNREKEPGEGGDATKQRPAGARACWHASRLLLMDSGSCMCEPCWHKQGERRHRLVGQLIGSALCRRVSCNVRVGLQPPPS